jgi:hypothetical protein
MHGQGCCEGAEERVSGRPVVTLADPRQAERVQRSQGAFTVSVLFIETQAFLRVPDGCIELSVPMAGPYAPGDSVAVLKNDPEGMRVHRATVTEVTQVERDTWRVVTTHGDEIVDRGGEGPSLVPVDPQLAQEFAEKGDGFLVESTVRDIERHLDQSLDWQSLERNLGQDGRGRGR